MTAQLLRDFVAEPWLEDLDLATMERENTKFHGDDGNHREGDIVWRIPMRGGGNAYLLLLLEFQSRSDRWMALRVLVYVGLLWQQLLREKRITAGGRLPPVLPLVLYNGDARWAAPTCLADLIALPDGSPFWQWQPSLRYFMIDEGAYSAEQLAQRNSLAALLFRLEHCDDLGQLPGLVDEVIAWFAGHPGFEALRSAFAMLAVRLIEMNDGASPAVKVTENLLEVRTMLATRFVKWQEKVRREALEEARQTVLQEGREEGREEGRREGRQEGWQEGQREALSVLLIHQMNRRFGELPDWARQRIATADSDTLQRWGVRLLDVTALEDVFRDD